MAGKILAALMCVCFEIAIPAFAQKPQGGGIVYSGDVGATISAPKNWIFDDKNGLSQGLQVVMYPVGSTWANASVIMYVNIVRNQDPTMNSFIDGDIEKFKSESPNLMVEKSTPITMINGPKAEVRMFSGDKWGNHECIAYAPKENCVVIFVLSSRNKEGLTKNLEDFKEMVSQSALMKVNQTK